MVLKIFTEVYRYNKKKKGDALRQRRHYAKKRDREFDNDTGYEKLPENYKYTRGRPPTAYKMLLASQSSANSLSGPNVALLDTLLHTSKYDKFSHEDFIAEIEGLKKEVAKLVLNENYYLPKNLNTTNTVRYIYTSQRCHIT